MPEPKESPEKDQATSDERLDLLRRIKVLKEAYKERQEVIRIQAAYVQLLRSIIYAARLPMPQNPIVPQRGSIVDGIDTGGYGLALPRDFVRKTP